MRMATATSALMAFGCALYAMTGCSKTAEPAKTIDSSKMTEAAPPVASSVCDHHILKLNDLAGILNTPITGAMPLPGDAQSCEFTTSGFSAIIISVRPGLGRTTVDAWATGKMLFDSGPLTGVGDGGVWLETLHEVVAQQDAILCDIQVRGGVSDLALSTKVLPVALGALCNKIFAAY